MGALLEVFTFWLAMIIRMEITEVSITSLNDRESIIINLFKGIGSNEGCINAREISITNRVLVIVNCQ